MFFYDSYLILDHNQVHSSWIFIKHLTISVSISAPVCFSSFHCTHTYCLRFFMTHCLVQILIWIFRQLANIQTKKKESFKNVEYKKKWKIGEFEANFHVFWRSGLVNFMFYCCFVRFVVLLSALCYSNWFLHCVLYIGLSFPSIEVEFIPSIWHKIAMSTVAVSEHFFFSIFSFFFIYSSALIGSYLWFLPFFLAFNFLLVTSWISF